MTPGVPDTGAAKPPAPRSWLAAAVAAAVVVTLLIGAFALSALVAPEGPLEITAVSVSTQRPLAHEQVVVAVSVVGGSWMSKPSVSVDAVLMLGNGPVGGASGTPGSDGRYTARLGPWDDGAAVWVQVSAATGTQVAVHTQDILLLVGAVLLNGTSDLQLSNISHSPATPDPLDVVQVRAQITSAANITEPWLFYRAWGPKSGGGGGMTRLLEEGAGAYAATLDAGGFGWPGMFERGTQYQYRIAVRDHTGNTALSEIRSFVIR